MSGGPSIDRRLAVKILDNTDTRIQPWQDGMEEARAPRRIRNTARRKDLKQRIFKALRRFHGEQFHGGGGVEFDGVGNNLSRALTGSSFVRLLAWIDLM